MKRFASRGARLAGRLGPPGRALRNSLYERIASEDYKQAGELRPILVRVVNEDLTDLLPQVKASTLIVWGENDSVISVRDAHEYERLIDDARKVTLAETGHVPMLERPGRFNAVLEQFLAGDPAPEAEVEGVSA